MAFVLQREVINEDNPEADAAGVTIIETRGLRHRIEFSVDHIINQPKIAHDISPSSIEIGTKVTVEWPPKWEWSQTAFKSLVGQVLGGERTLLRYKRGLPMGARFGSNRFVRSESRGSRSAGAGVAFVALRALTHAAPRARDSCHTRLLAMVMPIRRGESCVTTGPFSPARMRRPVLTLNPFRSHHWRKLRTR
jgi:hypothetical protein